MDQNPQVAAILGVLSQPQMCNLAILLAQQMDHLVRVGKADQALPHACVLAYIADELQQVL